MPTVNDNDMITSDMKATPMSALAEFENRYVTRCIGCGAMIPPGTRVQGIRQSSSGKWAIWHPAAICVAVVRQKGIIGPGPTAAQVHHAKETKSFEEQLVEAYEKEAAAAL